MKQITFATTYKPLDSFTPVSFNARLSRFVRSPLGTEECFFAEAFSVRDHDYDTDEPPAVFEDVFVVVTTRPESIDDDDAPDGWTFSLYDDHGNAVIDFDRENDEACTITITNGRAAYPFRRVSR